MAFARATGLVLLFAFGTQFLILTIRARLVGDIEDRMRRQGQFAFANVDRAEERRNFLGVRYFYSYSGRVNDTAFRSIEEVSPQYFHLHSEGKNVEVLAYVDSGGNAFTHLRGNAVPVSKDFRFLSELSLALALVGLGLSVIGYLGAWLYASRHRPR